MEYGHLIREMTWSHSRISSFHDCPYQFYLKYIALTEPQKKFFASYGSFVHFVLEKFFKGELSQKELPSYYSSHFWSAVASDAPSQKILLNYFQNGLDYVSDGVSFNHIIHKIEYKMSFSLGGYPFVGYADLISSSSDQQLIITDHKSKALKDSAQKKPSKDAEKILRQMYLYSVPIHQDFGRYPDFLSINCYRIGKVFTYPFDQERLQNAVSWAIGSIEQIVNTKDWLPNIESFKCRYICDVSDHCDYYQMFKR